MTDTERLAREWAQTTQPKGDAKTRAAIEHIMATTTPQTMADVEWEDEKHYLAGAVDADGHEVAMLAKLDKNIRVCYIDQMGLAYPMFESPKTLTPNGKRYELREVGAPEEPEHPATLETQADYENAPEGTVVAEPRWQAWQKRATGKWVYAESKRDSGSIAGTERRVLRWGWGE